MKTPLPARFCCCEHFAQLVGLMSVLDCLLMLTIGRNVKAGVT
jgi:hypothetical protein